MMTVACLYTLDINNGPSMWNEIPDERVKLARSRLDVV